MARKIVVTSGKGGVGKTTITANLGYALAKKGLRVAMMDLDLGLNNLDVAFGVENKVVFDVVDVIEGRCRLKQAFLQNADHPSLYILPSCHSSSQSCITAQNVRLLTQKMNDMFDYIFIDSPAGIDNGFHRAASCADEAIVVCTPHVSSIRDADKVLHLLKSYDLLSVKIVVNRLRGDLVQKGEMIDAFQIFSLLNAKPLGIVPDWDPIATYAVGEGSDVTADSVFRILAQNLHDGTSFMYDCSAPYKGFWGKIKRRLLR